VWHGSGASEKGVCQKTGKIIVEVDPQYYRPTEVDLLCGDSTKAQKLLGWNPHRTSFQRLIEIMVENDFDYIKKVRKL
jgi:GDPmannose 4,6-dehydratase